MSYKSGHKIAVMTKEEEKHCKKFTGRSATVKLQPGGWMYFDAYREYADEIYEFEVFNTNQLSYNASCLLFYLSVSLCTFVSIWTISFMLVILIKFAEFRD